MELKFVLGKSAENKTKYCIDEMLKLPQSRKVIYIVPEQFTLESERLLTSLRKSLINIDVVSFKRLRFHIEGEAGKINKEFLDDEAKNMILRRIISSLKLEFFKKSASKAGFLDSIERIISEFYQFGITPEALREKLKTMEETAETTVFIKKMTEICQIYSAYNSFISDKYISSDNVLDFVADKIKDTTLFDGAYVYIDGFNSFTSQEYRIISEIMAFSDRVTAALCLNAVPEKAPDDALTDPFYETNRAYIKLLSAFKELFPTGKVTNITVKGEEAKAPSIKYLEEHFFDFPTPKFGKTKDIKLISAVSKKAEISAVCEEICSLASEGVRYRETGIILCDPTYTPLLKAELKRRNIPDFTDSRTPILTHPCARFILSLIKTAAGFKTTHVFSMLKTGLTDIGSLQTSRLEKYALEYGIDLYRWQTPFKDEYFESVRLKLTEIISPLTENFKPNKAYAVSEINRAVFEAIDKSGFYFRYKQLIEDTEDEILKSRYKQVWEQVVSTFDKAEEFLGDSLVTLEEYAAIIESGFSKKSVATIPLYQDNIIIGDIERSRLPRLKALFVVGANKGNLPQKFEDTDLVGDSERALMKQNGMEIAADTGEQLSLHYLKIYQILTKPTDRLYISLSLGTNKGEKLETSEIERQLETMFDTEPVFYEEKAVAPIVKTPFEPSEVLTPETAEALAGETLRLSSSKLDRYAKCPYSYFLSYVLRLNEDKMFEITSMDKGTFLHAVMERFFKDSEAPESLTPEETDAKIKEIIPKVIDNVLNNLTDETGQISDDRLKLKYFINRLKKTADVSVKANLNQLKASLFRPAEFEVSFGGKEKNALPPVKISDDIILTGVIDRVDLWEDENDSYVKITDYKSSSQTLDTAEIENGLKLQLLLYLSAYTEEKQKTAEKSKTIRPGGLMYFIFNNPKTTEDALKGKAPESLLEDSFKPVGIASSKTDQALDSGNKYSANIVKVSEDELNEIMEKAKQKALETGSRIKHGDFPINPYSYSDKHGCDYCPYSGICKIGLTPNRCNKIS